MKIWLLELVLYIVELVLKLVKLGTGATPCSDAKFDSHNKILYLPQIFSNCQQVEQLCFSKITCSHRR
jgi:hypothetical protein